MVTILKPGVEKIMALFYRDKDKKHHLREIARKTKLYGQSVSRYLNNLEKNNILISKKEGNMKNYSIAGGSFSIFAFFDAERLEKLPKQRKDAVSYYLDKLDEKPVFAVLFGSTAKESYAPDSDIDILLVVNKKIEAEYAENEADALTAVKISTFQINYKDFLKEIRLREDKVVQSAINTGYPLINHISYYGALYNERI